MARSAKKRSISFAPTSWAGRSCLAPVIVISDFLVNTVAEKRYLVEYEIESHGILDSIDHVTFCHPKRDATIELRDKSVEPGQYFAVLSAYLVFEAASIEEAQNNSDEMLAEFIDLLTFITNMSFRIGNKLRIIDWTLGIEEREYWILNKFRASINRFP